MNPAEQYYKKAVGFDESAGEFSTFHDQEDEHEFRVRRQQKQSLTGEILFQGPIEEHALTVR